MNKISSLYIAFGSFAVLFLLFKIFSQNGIQNQIGKTNYKICGVTLVAPPKPFPINPTQDIKMVHANWVALIPYAYSPLGIPEVRYGTNSWQWWGETKDGIIKSIELAQKSNLKIMLKPQVYMHNGWTGSLNFELESDWIKWELDYEKYILSMVDIAKNYDVDLFCIGTEWNQATAKRPIFWKQLIQKIRSKYQGLLTYSANWDNYLQVPFWNELDYIGISAYFPLVESHEPSPFELKSAWTKYIVEMDTFSKSLNKPILFTEFGYLTVPGCGGKTWELEKMVDQLPINQQAQANCYEALFQSLWDQRFWAGGFVWKWFPNDEGHEGYIEKDYSPQHKQAEQILKKWYANSNH